MEKPLDDIFFILPGKNNSNHSIFSVLVKRTYEIRPNQTAVRTNKAAPFIQVDEYYDEGGPEWTTVKYETDLVPYKAATDVVVIGKVYSPDEVPVQTMTASVEINDIRKTIHVSGNRRCIYRENQVPAFTEPVEFTAMEMRYERAYGGWDRISDPAIPFVYPRNPMGIGIAVKNVPDLINGLEIPNFEDPQDPLTPERLILNEVYQWNGQPLPQGLGWFQRTWYPRCSFVGAVPGFVEAQETMREETLGMVPKKQISKARQFKLPSFDVRFNNGASQGMILPFLSGGESVKLTNMTPDGSLEFKIPNDFPKIILDIGLGKNELKTELHTLSIRPDDTQIDMVWRGAHEYAGTDWLPEMKRMDAQIF